MEKAFDTKELIKDLTAVGLPVAEVGAEKVAEVVYAWLEKSAALSPNAILKAAIPLTLAVVKPIIATELNKIDGNPAE
ncbi:MAG: hypothetical protein KBE16_00465 [Alphaproteobacteria bacterium]|nr:hypothetical protein [Alphaproteobacteria bacterium]